jgi:hypothetical protein
MSLVEVSQDPDWMPALVVFELLWDIPMEMPLAYL